MAIETTDAADVDAADILGSAVERREDPALVTGEVEYTDDIGKVNLVHLAVKRSQFGHARVTGIDTSAAEALDGVLAVFTASDVEAAGVPGTLPASDYGDTYVPDHPILAGDRVRYQGDPVAAVVAEDRYMAHEAMDRIDVEYERLDVVTAPAQAVEADDAPVIHEGAPDNVGFDWTVGDNDAAEAALAEADTVVELEFVNNRLMPTPMEPRAAVASYQRSTGRLTVEMTAQKPHEHRQDLARTLGIPSHKIRVRAPDLGGGFGGKIQRYADEALCAFTSMQLGRPVKWQATRSEAFLSSIHGRDHDTRVRMGVDDDMSVRGISADTYVNLGAYVSTAGAGVPRNYGRLISGEYDVPAIHVRIRGAFTNTAPVDAYRGAGRPEGAFAIERLMGYAAKELGFDPVAFRRHNFIPSDAFPHEVATGHVYDSGDYEKSLEKALDIVDYEALRERQAALREEGRYLGIGLSCYVEACGSAPGRPETGLVRFHPDGSLTASTGSIEFGTGVKTTFAQIVADRLGVPYDDVEIFLGDTEGIPEGHGTSGSRAAPVAGSALVRSAEKVIEQARRIAAHRLEAAPADLDFEAGAFRVAGAPDRSMHIQEVAEAAYSADDLPEGAEAGLEATAFYDPSNYTFPFGTHIAVVEVDPATGAIDVERYVTVDDVGPRLNPKIVEGQLHGGIAQGVSQALYERVEYDNNANLVSGSMQDYTVPKAFHIPEIELDQTVTPCPHNPLGVKGVGEAGAIASPPAVSNAVADALAPLGIHHIDMPMTNERVWRTIADADGGRGSGGAGTA